MKLIETKEYFINLERVVYAEKLSNGDLYLKVAEKGNIQLHDQEAKDFMELLRKNGVTLEHSLTTTWDFE